MYPKGLKKRFFLLLLTDVGDQPIGNQLGWLIAGWYFQVNVHGLLLWWPPHGDMCVMCYDMCVMFMVYVCGIVYHKGRMTTRVGTSRCMYMHVCLLRWESSTCG